MNKREPKKKDCACCGKSFLMSGHFAIYCETCRKLPETQRERMKEARERAVEHAAASTKKKTRRCRSFDISKKSLRRIDAECRLFGMSYGKYTAACRGGTIEAELKARGFKNPLKMLEELEVE